MDPLQSLQSDASQNPQILNSAGSPVPNISGMSSPQVQNTSSTHLIPIQPPPVIIAPAALSVPTPTPISSMFMPIIGPINAASHPAPASVSSNPTPSVAITLPSLTSTTAVATAAPPSVVSIPPVLSTASSATTTVPTAPTAPASAAPISTIIPAAATSNTLALDSMSLAALRGLCRQYRHCGIVEKSSVCDTH